MLEVSLMSKFLKEGKATYVFGVYLWACVYMYMHVMFPLGLCSDDDMISLASMMSVSNLSTIGFLEDEDDDYYWSVRSK